jgi:hypothetical protein
MASLFNEKIVNVCFGSLVLLGFEAFEQAIIDFNLEEKTFTFVV